MKKILLAFVFFALSGSAFARCENIFEENFSTFKLMRVSSQRTNFFNASLELKKTAVDKNDLVIVASTMKEYSCSYAFNKEGVYTAGYLKSANLVRNTVQQNLAGF